MVYVWLQPFLLFIFLVQHSSSVISSLFFQFLWLLATHFQYIQPGRRTFYCVRVFGIFFQLFYCCFACKIKSSRRLLKTMTIFLNFVVKTALMLSDWLLVVSFVFSANQKPFVICTRVASLHSCYRRTALLSQPIKIE